MPPLRVGLRLTPCVPLPELAAFACRAERAGFDTVWIPDSQFLWRDVWTAATMIADRTERIGIGVAVTNFETRHVAATASAIASVNELSGGRLRVAFGTGDSSVKLLGLEPTRHQRMREQIGVLRELLAGDEVIWASSGRYGGRGARLRHASGAPVPIFMAASGPKSLALAGEIADGVIVGAGVSPALVERALRFVASGASRAGRELSDLDLCIAGYTTIAPDDETAVRYAKPLVLAAAQLGMSGALASVGIELDVPPVIEGLYPDVTHAESWDLAVRVADQYVDGDAARRYAEAFTYAGTDVQVQVRLQALQAAGVTSAYLLGVSSYELPTVELEAFASTILPKLAAITV